MKPTYFLSTAIPYINAKPHLGHVLEWMQADAMARYQRLLGKDVVFVSGSDENSLKNVRAAEKAGVDTQAWLDEYAAEFKAAYAEFGIELDAFRRSSDQTHHWPGVQELWRRCDANGAIYKKSYQGLYCVGCEAFYTPDELVDGKCPEHLVDPEVVEEENYFFKLSAYQDQIKSLIESNELRIISDQFRQEMLGFIDQGLQDFSISRSQDRARGVGVPVPHDKTQVMYVWFDALAVYMTSIGWNFDEANWGRYWHPITSGVDQDEIVHVIGKGINRFHSVYWIGMLLAAGLPTPTTVSVHGYITANGQKMSKSLGNVIDPFELVAQYGLEPVRYYLLKEIPTHSDGDFNYDKFGEVYTADLANGLGNLCSRVAKLAEKAGGNWVAAGEPSFDLAFQLRMGSWQLDHALKWIVEQISQTDQFLSETKPWTQTGEAQRQTLQTAIDRIRVIAFHLQPFLPATAATILQHFAGPELHALTPLFPRLADPKVSK